jgi:SecD/SecF fusion protein
VKAGKESTDRAVEVLRRRVDALGVAEPTLTRSGDRRIIVELPGLQDPRQAADVIGRTAQLSFHPVVGTPPPTPAGETPTPAPAAADGEQVLPDEDGQPVRIGRSALTGDGVDGAEAELDPQGLTRWSVTVDFKGSGGSAWQQLTAAAACAAPNDPTRRVAIVLDDQVISSPQVDPSVPCEGRHRRRLDPDHRVVHREGSEGPRSPDPWRRAARARRGDRAADRRRHAGRGGDRGQVPRRR